MAAHRARHVSAVLVASFALVAAAGVAATPPAPTQAADRAAVAHVLSRVTFGTRPEDVERVTRLGIDAYLNQQLDPTRIDDSALEGRLVEFKTLTMSTADLADRYFEPAIEARRQQDAANARRAADTEANSMAPGANPRSPERRAPRQGLPQGGVQALAAQREVLLELTQAKMLRAVISERQLQEVLTDFWFNHFNVFVGKGQVRQYLTAYERDVIRPNVLGSFRALLGQVAHSPAMLFYLDNWQSSSPTPPIDPNTQRRLGDPRLTPAQRQRALDRLNQQRAMQGGQAQRRGLNENYARELMELHTLGVDAGYTQKDVVELARIFTGWTIDQPRRGGSFVFRPAMHDDGVKVLLGKSFAATGEAEGEYALDLLAEHPATARHIAFKLAQRFVADQPPPALVERVARVFTSTKGDLRAVTSAVLSSPEFRGPEYRRAKIKSPLEFVTSAVRATGATISSAQPLVAALQNLGMPLYSAQPPTGYDMTSATWVNTGALIARMNFAVELVTTGRIAPQNANGRGAVAAAGTAGGPGPGRTGRALTTQRRLVEVPLTDLAPDVSPATQQSLVARLLDGQAADATKSTLAKAQTPAQLVALALGSPEFQRR